MSLDLENINLGVTTGDKTGDGAKTGGGKINRNFQKIKTFLEQPDAILVQTGHLLAGQNLTYYAGWFWRINGTQYTNPVNVVINIPFTSSGKERFDLIALTTSNTFLRVAGSETNPGVVDMPDLPIGMIQVGIVKVIDSAIGEPSEPVVGDVYVKKTERQKVIISENVSSFTLIDERHFVEFTNPAQGNFNYFVQSSTYVSGQNHPFRIRNNTGHTFTLNHLTPSGSSIPGETLLFFQNAENFDIKHKEIIEFVYDTDNNRLEYFGVITDISGKEDSSNKTGTVIGNESSTSRYLHIAGQIAYFQQKLTDVVFGAFQSVLPTVNTVADTDKVPFLVESLSRMMTWANFKALFKTINGNSIFGSGNIELTKNDIGLNNVDNTSDLNKPISTATQTALNDKANDANTLHKTGDEIKTGVLTIENNLNLAAISVNSTNGFILKNNQPFIHSFYAGANPLTGGIGNNTFLGVNSGNFNSNNFTYASTMIGFESGMSNKNGYSNTGIGYYALRLNEDGFGNTALGTFVLGNSINGNQNTSVGWHSMLYRTGGSSNTGMGVDVLKENLLGNFNTAFGTNAGANNVSGDLNLFLGYAAGFNELGSSKLYVSNSSTSNPLIKGDFSTNSLALGGGVGNKVDIYGVGSIVKTDYRTHANVLTPVIYDASNYTFNLNSSGAFAINSTGAAVGLTSGNINKFEVLTASSTGGSGVNGMAVHDGQAQRMALLSGVNTASSYSWIQATKGGVGFRPIFLNPNGGGVSIGNTTDAGTGNINIAGKATAGSPATVANDLMRKGEVDTAIATADAGNMKLTGNQTVSGSKSFTSQTSISGTAPNTAGLLNIQGSGTFPSMVVSSGGASINAFFQSTTSNNVVSNITTGGTGFNFVGQNDNADTFTVNKTGQIKSNVLAGTGTRLLVADASGNITPATTLLVFADNTAAIAGGLGVGRPYRTVIGLLAIVF